MKETFESIDKKVEAKRKARNDFEALIFSSKEWLIDEKNEQYFDGEDEKSQIEKALETAENWLENEGYDSTIDLYKSKK